MGTRRGSSSRSVEIELESMQTDRGGRGVFLPELPCGLIACLKCNDTVVSVSLMELRPVQPLSMFLNVSWRMQRVSLSMFVNGSFLLFYGIFFQCLFAFCI